MPEKRIPSWLRTVLPWVITAGLLAIVFIKADMGKAFAHLKSADLKLFIPAVLFFNFYAFFINALIYNKLFNWFCGPISYKSVLSIRGASYLLTSVNPGAGQGGLFLWVSRKEHLPLKDVLSSAVLVPVTDMTFLAAALAIPLALNRFKEGFLPSSHVHILLAAVVVLVTLVLLHHLFWMGAFGKDFGKRLKASSWVKALREAKPKHYLILLGLRCLQHIPEITAYYVALMAFKTSVPISVFLVRFFPAVIIQYLPITIAQLGTSQGGWGIMFGDLVNVNILVAFTLSWNLLYFLSRIALGAFFFRGEARDYFRGDWRQGAEGAPLNTAEATVNDGD